LVGYTGGFIWGFLILVYLCGIGILMKNKVSGILFGIAGLAFCHLIGVLQFMAVAGMSFTESFLVASAPYLIKDVISVILAFIVGAQIRTRLMKAGLLL
ncbi:MAG: biotin transporter BioY, partial [Lachnospiraceae bacterium]|nr:biotin transporter BioY [Lachnospiraceae bacterium]